MQVEKIATYEIVLKLTKKEANFLHAVMQNPVYGENPDQENVEDRNMREAFFKATKTD